VKPILLEGSFLVLPDILQVVAAIADSTPHINGQTSNLHDDSTVSFSIGLTWMKGGY